MELAQICGCSRPRELKAVSLAPTKADVDDKVVGLEQSHVLDEQARHALSLASWSVGITPQSREVGGECEDASTLLLVNEGVGLSLALVVLPGCVKGAQL